MGMEQAFATLTDALNDTRAAVKAEPDVLFGTVSSVSGNTAQVALDGDTSATPCTLACAAKAGDRVTVIRRGTSACAVAKVGGDLPSVSTSTAVADVITAGTYITVSSVSYTTRGKVAQLLVTFTRSSAISDGQNFTVGTVASGKRPVQTAGGSSNSFVGWITDTGTLTVRNVTGAQIAANTTVYISFTYLLP